MNTALACTTVVFAALAFALVGCSGPTPSASKTATNATESDAPSPSPSSTEFPTDLSGTSTSDFNCTNLIQFASQPQIAPGYTEIDSYEPDEASTAKKMQDIGGLACGFKGSDGDIISFGFAHPDAASLTKLIAYYNATSQPTTTYGDGEKNPGFFTSVGGYGDGEAFLNGYWLSVGSKIFSSPDDAGGFIKSAQQDIPAG